MRQDVSEGRLKLLQRLAKDVSLILGKIDKSYWRQIMELSGCVEALAALPAETTLEDIDEDEWEALRKISVAALKSGMEAGNAQMVRAFQAADEIKRGEREIEGLVINVVPATVPDNMSEMLQEQLRELAEIANRD